MIRRLSIRGDSRELHENQVDTDYFISECNKRRASTSFPLPALGLSLFTLDEGVLFVSFY